jgi:hypothetical protein
LLRKEERFSAVEILSMTFNKRIFGGGMDGKIGEALKAAAIIGQKGL